VLRIATTSVPALSGIRTAIGGGPILIQNGKRQKVVGQAGEAYEISSRSERHPRTAVGWNQRHFFLVEVDGRQRDLSVGMTLDELSQLLLELGCQEAVSLDGGGSATLWYDGKIRNNPCDGYDRAIANALVVVKKVGKSGALPAARSN
jgi:exopolysaccharide biosynthesis protein